MSLSPRMMPIMHKRLLALIVGLGTATIACKDSPSVTDLNNVSAEALSSGLTRASTQLLVTGLLDRTRADVGANYIIFTETMARDFYRIDPAENRFITELVGANPADFSSFTGAGVFSQFYTTIRSAHTILNSLPSARGLAVGEIAATRGLAQTFKALAFYRALEARDSLGIPIDVNRPIDADPAPYVCKPNALDYISALLDSAATDLSTAGATIPIGLPPGFTSNGDFSTPGALLQFNRGLKGKVELYRGLDHQKPDASHFSASVAAINASFASQVASVDRGIYNVYSTASNETTNPIADANIFLNPFVGDSIQTGDLRASKIVAVTPKTLFGVTGKYKTSLTDPANLTHSIAILKNSELLLLRAQANIELGNLAAAYADINAVRTMDGGLAPLAASTKQAAIYAVLYEKRYSLLAESAERLVDLRAYGLLKAGVTSPNGVAGGPGGTGDIFQTVLPIPKPELDARKATSLAPSCS